MSILVSGIRTEKGIHFIISVKVGRGFQRLSNFERKQDDKRGTMFIETSAESSEKKKLQALLVNL